MQNISKSIGKLNLSQEEIGFLVVPEWNKGSNSRDDKDKVVGVYVPTLMSEIEMTNKPYVTNPISMSNSMIKNKKRDIYFPPVTLCNYILAEPIRNSNVEQPAFYQGENLRVTFTDGDLKKPRVKPDLVDENNRAYDRQRTFVKDKASIFSPDKEYESVMDSRAQKVYIATEDGRGEFDSYLFEIDAGNGKVTIKDKNSGNHFILNSATSTVELKESGGASLVLKNGAVTINAPGGIRINTPKLHTTGAFKSDSSVSDYGGNVSRY